VPFAFLACFSLFLLETFFFFLVLIYQNFRFLLCFAYLQNSAFGIALTSTRTTVMTCALLRRYDQEKFAGTVHNGEMLFLFPNFL
jgi:hypothetical protein